MMKKRKTFSIVVAFLAIIYLVLNKVAKEQKADSVYNGKPEQKNTFEGKKVVFIKDENDSINADGVRGHLEAIGDTQANRDIYNSVVKRGIDKTISFIGLVALSPILAGIAIAIKLEDPGPALFTQKRVGENKQYFKLHKFRSMKMSTPHDVPTHMLEDPEQYITKVGHFLRSHSLDELPQIWDIFIGNMSIIGPRPALWNQDRLVALRDQYNANNIKPGLTGWAQINGRDELELEDKAKLDGEYVENIGILMDTKCFYKSIPVVGKDDSIVEGKNPKKDIKVFRRYTIGKKNEELIGHIGFSEPITVDTNRKVKIIIVGKSSYIGESLIDYASKFYKGNFEIDTVDTIPDKDGHCEWENVNFGKYDVVFHVAGMAHADIGNVSDNIKEKYYCVNTDLAINVAEKAKLQGAREFIFMSSMIVYGDSAPVGKSKLITKNTVPQPANFYGDSKLQADVAVRELADESFKVIVIRPPMIYGKESKGNFPILIKMAKSCPLFPSIGNQRSMLYIDNLCQLLCQIMLIKNPQMSTVLLPQNDEYSKTSEIVRKIGTVHGRSVHTVDILNPIIKTLSRFPGKIGVITNKAFGNLSYEKSVSRYIGITYQVKSLDESILEMK